MNADASLKFGCKEKVSDTCNQSLKEENIKYTPNQKRLKLRHSAPLVEHRSVVVSTIYKNHSQVLPHHHFQECSWELQGTQFIQQQEYLMGGISQVCTKENYCKKRSQKCLSRRASFCSTASGELHLPIDAGSLVEENDASNNTTIEVQPQLRSYQLVGDSLLLRFAEQILHMEANTDDGVRCIGLCVSGQKVADLLHKVKLELYPVGDKIVLLIGTNDILQKTEESQMHRMMWTLLKELCRRARRIVLLTLPPIPKIQFRPDHWERIEGFNMFIKSLEDDVIMVADISQLYITESKTCKMEFFERYYRDGERKDLIHLNKLGLTKIHTYLTDNNCLI